MTEDPFVVVVGPVFADNYFLGHANRLDHTAAVPVVEVRREHVFSSLGGAANTANCLAHLAMHVSFVTVVGDDAAGHAFMDAKMSKASPFITKYARVVPGYQTPLKHRIYSDGKLVARYDIDEEPKLEVSEHIIELFRQSVASRPPAAILISDYAKGICTEQTLDVVMNYAAAQNIPVIVDPTPAHVQWYRGATIITPNESEACAAAGSDDLYEIGKLMCKELAIDTCMITRGDQGLLVFDEKHPDGLEIPAIPAHAIDTCGAGDVVSAVCAYGLAMAMPREAIYRMATIAGAIAVEAGGAHAVPLHAIHRRTAVIGNSNTKHVTLPYASLLRLSVAASKEKFGITNGVFDTLHAGHVSTLSQAKQQCDFLLVLVNSDQSAERIKRKPLQSTMARVMQLAALPAVDAIMVFDEDTPASIIAKLVPDVLVKGPEFAGKEETIPGYTDVIAAGGRVCTTTLEHDIHSTIIRKHLEERPDAESAPIEDTADGGSTPGAGCPAV